MDPLSPGSFLCTRNVLLRLSTLIIGWNREPVRCICTIPDPPECGQVGGIPSQSHRAAGTAYRKSPGNSDIELKPSCIIAFLCLDLILRQAFARSAVKPNSNSETGARGQRQER